MHALYGVADRPGVENHSYNTLKGFSSVLRMQPRTLFSWKKVRSSAENLSFWFYLWNIQTCFCQWFMASDLWLINLHYDSSGFSNMQISNHRGMWPAFHYANFTHFIRGFHWDNFWWTNGIPNQSRFLFKSAGNRTRIRESFFLFWITKLYKEQYAK